MTRLCSYSSLLLETGGFATYLIAMSDTVAKQFPGPVNANDMKNPGFGWMTMFLLLSSSAGLFTMLPLRKVSMYSQIAD